ncbi:DUF4383 domain-containing protein [Intrasporangium sp. YIM S08009]|uniref:DUF4383 domain-containing protein n=1 Tax=Intrasporangium zincisolvens TaxID=3080018 RepID=UPI002B054001|nr:DUF4383 domain-containing protein [Intrasporangium sp. YIM S08009]
MTERRTAVQGAALVVGLAFLAVGIAGFVPGVTADYSNLGMAGHHSGAMLLGVFQVSVLHNVVHLLYGVVGILAARRWTASRVYLIGGGALYLVLWLYGLFVEKTSAANFVPLNRADDWLHLVLGLGMVALGVVLGRRPGAHTIAGHDARYGDWRRDSASS